jgi:hypothetical protein
MVCDVWQELRCISIEVEREEFDQKEQYKSIQRKIYAFLRRYGYRRPKHSKGYVSNTKSLQYWADSILNGALKNEIE